MDFQIEVNNTLIDVQEGQTLLTALRNHGFRVPTLCHMSQFSPTGACRLCVVEVEGKRDLITSCSYPVEQGMQVKTNSQRVIRARKSLVELLLSNHPDDCLYCERNGNCELQWLAEDMNVKERKYFGKKTHYFPDNSSASVFRDPAKCVLCSRCVRVCEEVQLVTAIDFIGRGTHTKVNSAFHKGLNVSSCINCGQCIMVCPTGALVDISHLEKVEAALESDKQVVFFVSPSAVASIGEFYGLKPSGSLEGIIAASLKKIGAHQVFNLGVGNDINIKEESNLLISHLENYPGRPLLSSDCPAWVKYVEAFRADLIPSLSTVKSPQQIFGSLMKDSSARQQNINSGNIYTVGIMPCVAKKFEASREEMTHKGISEVDAVLTIREFIRLMRAYGIDMRNIPAEEFDEPYNQASAAAWKMSYSGGKAEAIARETFQQLNRNSRETFKFTLPKNLSGKKETKIIVNGQPIGFAWVSGIAEAEAYITQLQEEGRTDIHYIEVEGCPMGCVGGGGQPISHDLDKPKARKKICVEMEKQSRMKIPGENPGVDQFYSGNPEEQETARMLFHTEFAPRKVLK
ncbi:MAG: [Fe-Fe] hydrogenase large subunit C-terminal domain-containing protein [Bacteroidales bacterium]